MISSHVRAACAGMVLFSLSAGAQQFQPYSGPAIGGVVSETTVKAAISGGGSLLFNGPGGNQGNFTPQFLPFWGYITQAAQDANVAGCTTFLPTTPTNCPVYSGPIIGSSPTYPYGVLSVSTPIIPVILNVSFSNPVTVSLDPTSPDPFCLTTTNYGGNTAKTLLTTSPLFAATNFNINGQFIPITQYQDAIVRAEFWNSPGFLGTYQDRLHMNPVQYPPLVINVAYNDGTGNFGTNAYIYDILGSGCGGPQIISGTQVNLSNSAGSLNINFLDPLLKNYIVTHGIMPSQFPFFLLYKTMISNGPANNLANCCIGGYHSIFGPSQTYGIANFEVNNFFYGGFAEDVSAASHEINEWVNDPAVLSNNTPPWGNIGQVGGCQTFFEVGDPFTGSNMPAITQYEYTYHLQEMAFFNWFYGGSNYAAGPRNVNYPNGPFSSNGTFHGWSRPCPPGGTYGAYGLIQDGGFESPVVGPGGFQSGYQVFNVGQTFGGPTANAWTVVGAATGNVAIYPNTETAGSPPTPLNVEEGSQALDLTGSLDNGQATGVQQSITTTVGTIYTLTFWVGEFNNSPASVVVNLNGVLFQTATNSMPTTGNVTLWKMFTYTFTATATTTTIQFINNSLAGVAIGGLDLVTVY
jgi:hypothetical protein